MNTHIYFCCMTDPVGLLLQFIFLALLLWTPVTPYYHDDVGNIFVEFYVIYLGIYI